MRKLPLLAAAAAGYVLGTRAGRERYEQIKSGARKVSQNPKVQSVAHKAQDAAAQQASAAAEAAKELAKDHLPGSNGQVGMQATP